MIKRTYETDDPFFRDALAWEIGEQRGRHILVSKEIHMCGATFTVKCVFDYLDLDIVEVVFS